jgi:flavin-dependent dehydrogenase
MSAGGTTDVVIAGGGPGGALAAYLLARAGARVTVFERSRFPRPKLCGDTLNPGAVALLGRHFDLTSLVVRALPIDGMLLSGPGPVQVRGAYGPNVHGLAVSREVFDQWLIAQAVRAGARLEEGATVSGPEVSGDGQVRGVRVRRRTGPETLHLARLTFGADGRRSRLGEACGLSGCAARPRRWAIGAYYEGVGQLRSMGEMHVRDGHYIGVAPTPDGRANACLVQPFDRREGWGSPDALLAARLRADPLLGPRFARARRTGRPVVLGPLAIDVRRPGCDGLLLLGDAAGFVDPMTGDGIRLALASAEAAVEVALRVLDDGSETGAAHLAYAAALQPRIGRKRTFNRLLRTVVGSPRAIRLAARTAAVWPGAFGAIIRYAGDAGTG